MSNVYISGTQPNHKLINQVSRKLEERYHTVTGPTQWDNPVIALSDIIHSDVSIFIFQKVGFLSLYHPMADVMVELGIAVGGGKLTIVVGDAEPVKILEHPWVRRMGLQELLHLINSNRHLDYIPPTQENLQEEKERRDREAKL